MSSRTKGCEKPDQLKGKPQDCSPEQIQKCHGYRRVTSDDDSVPTHDEPSLEPWAPAIELAPIPGPALTFPARPPPATWS